MTTDKSKKNCYDFQKLRSTDTKPQFDFVKGVKVWKNKEFLTAIE